MITNDFMKIKVVKICEQRQLWAVIGWLAYNHTFTHMILCLQTDDPTKQQLI